MNMIYQDTSIVTLKIIKRFTKNPRTSLSGMFRSLRKDDRFFYIGDYPLLANIVETIDSLNIKTNRPKLTHAIKFSPELNSLTKKEKTSLLNQLFKTCNTSNELR